jgi:hypothetical protein
LLHRADGGVGSVHSLFCGTESYGSRVVSVRLKGIAFWLVRPQPTGCEGRGQEDDFSAAVHPACRPRRVC